MSPRGVFARLLRRFSPSPTAAAADDLPEDVQQALRVDPSGAPAPRLACIGHSHIRTVAAAARRYGVPFDAIDFWSTGEQVISAAGRPRFREDIAERLSGTVFSMVGGAAFNIMALCVHPRRFDFVLPSAPLLPFDPQAELVPAAAARAALLQMTQKYLDLMGYVRDAAKGPVFHVEAPPPFGEDWRRLPPALKPFFTDKRREISPRYFRYKMWRLHSEINQQFCASHGIGFIPHPPDTVDSEGFLLPRFYADPMHVNEAYGARVLAQMRRLA